MTMLYIMISSYHYTMRIHFTKTFGIGNDIGYMWALSLPLATDRNKAIKYNGHIFIPGIYTQDKMCNDGLHWLIKLTWRRGPHAIRVDSNAYIQFNVYNVYLDIHI